MWAEQQHQNIIKRQHDISNNVIYATSKASDQQALKEAAQAYLVLHLSESTLPHCWKFYVVGSIID